MIAGLVLTLTATVLHIIGFATTYWLVVTTVLANVHSGIWKSCVAGLCVDIDTHADNYFKSVQAMECLALVAIVLASASALVGLLVKTGWSVKRMVQISGFLNILAAICIIIGLAIFGDKFIKPLHDLATVEVGYSLILCAVAGAMALVAGVVFTLKAGIAAGSQGYSSI